MHAEIASKIDKKNIKKWKVDNKLKSALDVERHSRPPSLEYNTEYPDQTLRQTFRYRIFIKSRRKVP